MQIELDEMQIQGQHASTTAMSSLPAALIVNSLLVFVIKEPNTHTDTHTSTFLLGTPGCSKHTAGWRWF